ncbi:class I mannose-6-phosphate isomerase [Anaerocolumna sp. AGMB13025]|uniref:class I mannose-6-phosphate isomerase n=1 Tax=Anaerocolumna sp. AGMB13025 TaxID=3039116 RepID=UPI00241D4EC6|nr:class I mannose-6-phosphate isomerase [Anaerocolumna sp. AGMB13025]WFR57907.1 class I mannose-6-phosphate isomerase [Anaerocolumna sp. AGMB13025]
MGGKYSIYNNYDLSPFKVIDGFDNQAFEGYESILSEIRRLESEGKRIFVFDLYPGVDKSELIFWLKQLNPSLLIDSEECAYDSDKITEIFEDNLTKDRVFGVMTHKKLEDCFDKAKIEQVQTLLSEEEDKLIVIVGVGAGLITLGDVYFYFDLSRWEIQLRYRRGMPNWRCLNNDAPILSKYKRGFFIEWRLADKHKKAHFEDIHYLVDTNLPNQPKMITGKAFCEALNQLSAGPFRLKPYFDPGVWGGQWMKEVFGLYQASDNYAWSFDGVPEENSLTLKFGNVMVEIPCMDLVLYRPEKLLGERVHARFGAEFPIRFDLLDTMEGGNLSLQVHPMTEYIQETFGMHYTQDESYYILEASKEEDTYVYLGVKEGIKKEDMIRDLEKARGGEHSFPADTYINKIPVRKHDHILIPAGTIHCSGKNTVVLEISATPYIFTFKLWDWGRNGLDGKPRPIHLEHGIKNIQWDRDTKWVNDNLIHQAKTCHEEEGITIERTGLHNLEFIDTYRYTFEKSITCLSRDSVTMLNLVDGAQMTISSTAGEFKPFDVHYAETVIIPASVKEYQMTPSGLSQGKQVTVITASVRG